jgi:predicted GH43/DUF377 family glycosyl hydrolase
MNPLLAPPDITPSRPGLEVTCLLNPGVFRYNNKTWLLLRVAERPIQKPGKTSFPIFDEVGKIQIREFDNADPKLDLNDPRVIRYDGRHYLTTLSHLRLVSCIDGIHFREDASYPLLFGKGDQESYGIEDCRVIQMEEVYYLTYTQVSHHGVGVGLRSTKDWQTFTHHGMIIPPHNKDCAIFGERINGKYYALHRPSSPELGGNYIWIAESPDLEHWGHHRCIAHTRPGSWDSARVGAGATPIKTDRGWLVIYHGANADHRYCLGSMLLDLNDPTRVITRTSDPIMEPTASYEQQGFFGNVVFTNGHLVDDDIVTLYYGASDTVICGATLSIKAILRTF